MKAALLSGLGSIYNQTHLGWLNMHKFTTPASCSSLYDQSSCSAMRFCCCMKPRLSDIFDPKPRTSGTKEPERKGFTDVEAAFESPNMKNAPASVQGRFGQMGGEGLAVEKDSDDPYLDFRHSMLQMIVENEISSKNDLKELLNCFLQLNAVYHHGIIIRAFTEIWNGMSASPAVVKRVKRKPRQGVVY